MPTLDASWSAQFRKISELERPDHFYLSETDNCLFLGEYTARAGYQRSYANQLILNLKKSPLTRGTDQWKYKGMAIREVAQTIQGAIRPERLPNLTFVPIPSSKSSDHAEYDDRMQQICRLISPTGDVRELLYTAQSRDARHNDNAARDPVGLRATLAVQQNLLDPPPRQIVLVDDVITTGCSFKVCREMLSDALPGVPITGLFVARRVPEAVVFSFDDLT
jgi:predicted amidophosphoribosyltransferase